MLDLKELFELILKVSSYPLIIVNSLVPIFNQKDHVSSSSDSKASMKEFSVRVSFFKPQLSRFLSKNGL